MPDRPIFISDFDGTLTDSYAGAQDYFLAYTAAMAQDLGLPLDEVRRRMQAAREEVLSKPADYGWEMEGHMVAPVGDHMILARVTAEKVLNAVGPIEDQIARMRGYFMKASEQVDCKFRPGAGEYIRTLNHIGRLVIITNSDTKLVSQKMAAAFPDLYVEIIGGAQKYQLTDLPAGLSLPVSIQPAGFPRPVLLQRGLYFQALSKAAGRQPLQAIAAVIGDIFELDLALPAALGLPIAMLTTPYTPTWEIPYIKKHGFVGQNLFEVTEWLVHHLERN